MTQKATPGETLWSVGETDLVVTRKAAWIAVFVLLLFGSAIGDGAGMMLRAWWSKAPIPTPVVGSVLTFTGPALPGNLVVQNGTALGSYAAGGSLTLTGGLGFSSVGPNSIMSVMSQSWIIAHGWSNGACVKCGQTPPVWDCHDVEIFDADHNTVFRGCQTCLLAQIAGVGTK